MQKPLSCWRLTLRWKTTLWRVPERFAATWLGLPPGPKLWLSFMELTKKFFLLRYGGVSKSINNFVRF